MSRDRPADAVRRPPPSGIDVLWIPLGAGGRFVRFNGRVYEALHAVVERRWPLDLYHTALEIHLPEGRYVIENAWPIPEDDGAARGVVLQGPVGSRHLARTRALRYEVRRWLDGTIADARYAVPGPQRVSVDAPTARRLLDLVDQLPCRVWGRDELGTGEMWNSNSVVSWLLARSGVPMDSIHPPAGGRAPGWSAGLVAARHDRPVRGADGPRPGSRRCRPADASGCAPAALGAAPGGRT